MSKVYRLVEQVRLQIQRGEYGRAGERFMTVRELAERFNVSLATAQKIHGKLKDEGVLIADSTNPAIISDTAVAPISSNPKRVGLVVTNIASPFFSLLTQHIQQSVQEKGYQALVASSEYDFRREREIIENFIDIGVEGLLICPGLDDRCPAYYRQIIERGVPLVMVSRRLKDVPCDFVAARNFVGGASVGEHFIDQGFTSFGYLAFGPRLREDERLRGFQSALSEHGYELPESYIAHGDGWDIQHGRAAMAKLMSLPNPPRAVFAFNDLLAIGAMRYCQEHGIGIPSQVAVAGFDNLAESRVTVPPLTTVEYPVQAMANLSVQCLINKITAVNDGAFHHVQLEPRLVIRASTDANWRDDSSGTPQSMGAAYRAL